jgi:hypothetical protein
MTHDEIRRHELSDFLRTRRARITPAAIGFPTAHRRRTPGLRRPNPQFGAVWPTLTLATFSEPRLLARVSLGRKKMRLKAGNHV